jgi:hypothetical protein
MKQGLLSIYWHLNWVQFFYYYQELCCVYHNYINDYVLYIMIIINDLFWTF